MLSKIFFKTLARPHVLPRYPLSRLSPLSSLCHPLHNSQPRYFSSQKPSNSQDSSNVEPTKIKQTDAEPKVEEKTHETEHAPKKGALGVAWEYAKEFIHLCIEGSKQSWRDGKYAMSVRKSKTKEDYTVTEVRDLRRIRKDQLKLIPFSFFVIIPLAELLLPPYLIFFPNAIPRPFMPDHVKAESRIKLRNKQEEAFTILKNQLDIALIEFGYVPGANDLEIKKKIFLENKDKIAEKLNIYQLESVVMRSVGDLLMMEYFDGTNFVNQLYKHTVNFPRYVINLGAIATKNPYRAVWTHPFFNYYFTFSFFPFENIKKALLGVQIKWQLESARAQNVAIRKFGVENVPKERVDDIARERGIWEVDEKELRSRLVQTANDLEKLEEKDSLIVWNAVLNLHKQPQGEDRVQKVTVKSSH